MNRFAIALFAVVLAACPGKNHVRDYPPPTAEQLLAALAAQRDGLTSYSAEAVMDYWVGDQRVKGTVLVMGKRGAYIRFNALLPSGGNVAADLACNGEAFGFVDYQENCQLTGLCNADAIAQLLRVRLAPDDFLLLALGQTPIIVHETATLSWNEDRGAEVLKLAGPSGPFQEIVLRRHDAGWQVLESTVKAANGNVLWKLEQKDFATVQTADGNPIRVPEKTRFVQPAADADLIVDWESRDINVPLDDAKFHNAPIDRATGLPQC